MRSHEDIIADAGGPAALGRKVGADPNTAKKWKQNGSIPSAYWAEISRQEIATLEELAAGAETRRPDREGAAAA